MEDIKREDLQIIVRHSNLSLESVKTTLKQSIYNKKEAWKRFLEILFISLGVGFISVGFVFFFAYNWQEIGKVLKFGIILVLIISSTLITIFSKFQEVIKNILLTGASLLVGVLFAVFGQVYQTGANSFDFFLMWSLFIIIWVLVSNFPVLWLIFITLINITTILYFFYFHSDYPFWLINLNLTLLNSIFLIFFILDNLYFKKINMPNWFRNLIFLTCITMSTTAIINQIFLYNNYNSKDSYFENLIPLYFLIMIILYIVGTLYSIFHKIIFNISIIYFSVLLIITSIILKFTDFDIIYMAGFFLIFGLIALIYLIKTLKKEWEN